MRGASPAASFPHTLGPESSWLDKISESPFHELVLFVCLLVGMIARVLSLAIEQREKRKVDTGLRIDKWQFIYPLLFAVPTFGGLLSQIQTKHLGVADVVLAFQTGFFWQTILRRTKSS